MASYAVRFRRTERKIPIVRIDCKEISRKSSQSTKKCYCFNHKPSNKWNVVKWQLFKTVNSWNYLVPPNRYNRLPMTRQTWRRRGFGTIPLVATKLHWFFSGSKQYRSLKCWSVIPLYPPKMYSKSLYTYAEWLRRPIGIVPVVFGCFLYRWKKGQNRIDYKIYCEK